MTTNTAPILVALPPCVALVTIDGMRIAVKTPGGWITAEPGPGFDPEETAALETMYAELSASPKPTSKPQPTPTSKPDHKKGIPVPVVAVSLDGSVERFPSVKAAECAGHNRRHIYSCRKGVQKTHHGRRWVEVT